MTAGTKSAIAAGLFGAYLLGVWTAPQVREMGASTTDTAQVAMAPDAPEPRPTAAPARTGDATGARANTVSLAATAEPVQEHVRPLLNRGTDTRKSAEGFTDAVEFLAVAYAANNTEVPFVLLKHRVLNEKKSLAAAIRASKPELDATLEADRARLEARASVARMTE